MFWKRMYSRIFGKQLTSGMFEIRTKNTDAQWPSPLELMRLPVGRVLLKMRKVTREQVIEALEHQRAHGGMLGEVFVRLGHATPKDVTAALAAQRGDPA
jgi:hypothetical protein